MALLGSLSPSDFSNLCRLCGAKTNVLMGLHIFEREGDLRQIYKKITDCLPIQVDTNDKLPKMICEECVYKLDDLFDFRERSVKIELALNDILKNNFFVCSTSNTIEIPMETLICDADPHHASSVQAVDLGNDNALDTLVLSSDHGIKCEPGMLTVSPGDFTSSAGTFVSSQATLIQSSGDSTSTFVTTATGYSGESSYVTEIKTCEGSYTDTTTESYPRESTNDSYVEASSGFVSEEGFHTKNEFVGENFIDAAVPTDVNNGVTLTMTSRLDSSCMESLEVATAADNSASGSAAEFSSENGGTGGTWYFCDVCGKLSDSAVCQLHWKKCNLCGAYCSSDEAMLAHIEKSHTLTESKEEPIAQIPSKPGIKSCPECGKEYKSNYKLAEHMRRHTGEKPFKCRSCEKTFRSKIGLAQHEAKHTGQYDYRCATCGKGFQCKSYLVVHQKVHSDAKPYPCTQCGANFKTKQSLVDHQNRHLGVKPYLCEVCGRGFITKGLCKSHQRIHSGEDNRQYPCSVCNKMFVSKSYLTTHLRIHTGEKPFMCEVCGKGFLTRVDLRIHSTMHTGEKSFVCETCGKAFARRDALRCHRRSHTGERPYRCDICGQCFTQFSPMAIHKRLHTGERPYACDLCPRTFVSRSTMTSHRKKHVNQQTAQPIVSQEAVDS